MILSGGDDFYQRISSDLGRLSGRSEQRGTGREVSHRARLVLSTLAVIVIAVEMLACGLMLVSFTYFVSQESAPPVSPDNSFPYLVPGVYFCADPLAAAGALLLDLVARTALPASARLRKVIRVNTVRAFVGVGGITSG